jgi:enoyl-CoA hydratase
MDAGFQTFRIETADFITTVTLCRPELLNRFDGDAHTELLAVLALLAAKQDHRVIILEAEGKVFSAGGDLDEISRMQSDTEHCTRMFDEARAVVRGMLALEVPVVVALHGDAIGLGASVVLLCDIVVASRNAGICDPHVAIGLAAGDGGCIGWPAAAGMMRAKRYLLTGERIDAATAHQSGLVSDLVETPEDAVAAARKIARRIASLAPLAVQGTKRALNATIVATYQDGFEISCSVEEQTAMSLDVTEGVQAMREMRKPVFRGL